jgi:hypothetical protein
VLLSNTIGFSVLKDILGHGSFDSRLFLKTRLAGLRPIILMYRRIFSRFVVVLIAVSYENLSLF